MEKTVNDRIIDHRRMTTHLEKLLKPESGNNNIRWKNSEGAEIKSDVQKMIREEGGEREEGNKGRSRSWFIGLLFTCRNFMEFDLNR